MKKKIATATIRRGDAMVACGAVPATAKRLGLFDKRRNEGRDFWKGQKTQKNNTHKRGVARESRRLCRTNILNLEVFL